MKRRGLTLIELLTGMLMMLFVVMGSMSLFLAGLQTFDRTNSNATLTTSNEQGLRRVAEAIRGAMSVTINADGTQISYTMPAVSSTNDAITGEKEIAYPLAGDGVARSFQVNFTNGTLVDGATGRVLEKNITKTDPDPASSQYGQQYVPFQLTTIGSLRAVSINLITLDKTRTGTHYVRFKTTAALRNSQ